MARAQSEYTITVESKKPSGIINEMLYGQLFEHIYFSANNGVWQELIQERSFEPEQYPGIHPRDGYFDGWYMDDNKVLHSPTRYEQPLKIDSINTCDFDLTMDVNWRAYKLARRSWSGGLMDIRFAVRNKADGTPYYIRIHDPYYESRTFTPAQTQSQIDAANEAAARARLQQQSATADFSICTMEDALFEYYAPGSLTVANSMKNKHAVALQKSTPQTDGTDVVLSVPALSAGVLTITK